METLATLKNSIRLTIMLIIACGFAKVTELEFFAWIAIVIAIAWFLNLFCLFIYSLSYLTESENETLSKRKRILPDEIKLTIFKFTLCIKVYHPKEKIKWN